MDYKPSGLIAGSELEYKINVFRPDRISGWIYYTTPTDAKHTLALRVDGTECATLACDIFRGELDAGRFPSRDLGFRDHVPFEVWDGGEHHVALHVPDGRMVHGATLAFPDARLAEPEFYGLVESPRRGRLAGWVAHASGPVRLCLSVDGQDVGSDLADKDTKAGKQFPYGFEVMLPSSVFDGQSHQLALQADTPAGAVTLWQEQLVLETFAAPRLESSVPVLGADGLSGNARLVGDPGQALDLALRAHGRTELLIRTDPATGAFTFPAADLAHLPLSDRLEIVAEAPGLRLEGFPPDILAQTITATVDPRRKTLVLEAPFALAWPDRAELRTEESVAPVAIDLGNEEGPRARIVVPLAITACDGAVLEVGDVQVPVRQSLAFRTRLQRIGAVRAPDDTRVAAARDALLNGAEDPVGDPTCPDVSGAWQVDENDDLSGWVLDLVRPGRPLEVAVCADGDELCRTLADRPLLRSVSGIQALGVAAGFRVNLSEVVPDRTGPFSVYPVGPDGAFETPLKEEQTSPQDGSTPLSALMDCYRPRTGEYDRTCLRDPLEPDALALLICALEARIVPLNGCEPWDVPVRVGPALMRSMTVFATETLPALADTHVPLPHHGRVPAPHTMNLAPLLDALTLSAETRAACRDSTTWRGCLGALLADPLLRDFLDPSDPPQALALQRVHRGRKAPEMPVDLLDGALSQDCEALTLFDASGTQLWIGRPSDIRESSPQTVAPTAAYAAVLRENEWTLSPLSKEPGRPLDTRTDHSRAVTHVRVEGRVCEVDFSMPKDLRAEPNETDPETPQERPVWVTLGKRVARGTISGQQLRLVVPAVSGGDDLDFDLRLDHPDGPRPVGVPERVRTAPGTVQVRDIVFAVNRISAEVVASGIAEGDALVVRLDDDPETDVALPVAALTASTATAIRDVALPLQVLDGKARTLRIVLCGADGETSLCTTEHIASCTSLLDQWPRLKTTRRRKAALADLAKAGRADVVEAIFSAPQPGSLEPLPTRDAIEILVALRTRIAPRVLPEALEATFNALWAEGLAKPKSEAELAYATIQGIAQTQSATVRQRFPLSPLAESQCDFLVTAPVARDDDAARALAQAISARRFPIASALAEAHAKSDAPALLVQRARLAQALGETKKAEALARSALAERPAMASAVEALARSLAVQGRYLEAAAAVSGGKGLSAWCDSPPSYAELKLISALDWAGLTREILAKERPDVLANADRSDAVGGSPLDIASEGFSLFYVNEGPGDRAALFDTLRPVGCAQVVAPAPHLVPEMECIGGWALVLARPLTLDARLVRAIFAQGRIGDAVLQLWRCPLDTYGTPGRPEPVGAALRHDMMTAFGPMALSDFVIAASRMLRVKSILV